jgi:peptidoglycan/xylan/chitin deacetylase (PgdA/CDA1 family)
VLRVSQEHPYLCDSRAGEYLVEMARRLVSLTFDNGPFVGVTDRVLDELERRRILATFFVVGRSLARPGTRALAERAIAAGHLVGNHSATHSIALGELSDPRAVDAEIDDCESMLDGLRETPPLFRPFGNGGALDHRLLSSHAVQRLTDGGYRTVLWNSVPHDWDDPTGWVDTAVAHVRSLEHTVMVLHDTPGACVDRLPELLDRLEALEVEFTQDIPDSCIATRDGSRTAVVDALLQS